MVGKGTLLVILGFTVIFGTAGRYWTKNSRAAVENFVDYYDSTTSHNIAVSAANIAADSVFINPADTSLDLTGTFLGGSYRLRTSTLTLSGIKYVQLLATSSYDGRRGTLRDTVKALLKPRTFNEYAFFSQNENSTYWITGDTLWGPYHTEDRLYVSGTPVFYGKVTALNGTYPGTLPSGSTNPYFYGGHEWGVAVPLPGDISQTTSAATKTFSYPNSSGSYDVYFTFSSDASGGKVTYQTKATTVTYYPTYSKTTTSSPSTIVPLSSFGTPPVILVENGNAHVEGVVDGNVTVVAKQGSTGGSKSGNISIEGNTTYKNDPRQGASDDMLGLVADNDVHLVTQPSPADVYIDAAIFARTGDFGYEDYDGSTHNEDMGTIYLYGSITNKNRGSVGRFNISTNTIVTGFQKNYKYDDRFYFTAPPAYPATNTFEVVSWRE